MVRLTRLAPDCGAELLAKLEAYNPAGSVKDRIGVAMIDAAEAEGRIEPGRNTIVESTSGNTGIALAFVCAAKGYDLVLTMPQGMSRERENLLRLYGAEVVLVESMGGMDEAVEEARRICRERGDCWVPNQFSNPANPEIHRRTTAEEIWRDIDGRVDVLVGRRRAPAGRSPAAASGSRSATRTCAWWPWSRRPRRCCPAACPGPHKIQGIGAGLRARRCSTATCSTRSSPVDDEDAHRDRAPERRPRGRAGGHLGRRGALRRRSRSARGPEMSGKRIVVIVPDSGERYVSTPFFAP